MIIGRLLHADLGEVPYVDAPVAGCRGEDSGVMRGPSQVKDFVGMGLENVQSLARMPQVVQDGSLWVAYKIR